MYCQLQSIKNSNSLNIGNPKSVCSLPKETGMCFAYLTRYYYKIDEKRCVRFIFGGNLSRHFFIDN